MVIRSILLSFVAAFAPVTVWADAGSPSCDPVLVLGDSISAGFGIDASESWVALLEQRLAEEGYGYPVVNASISGDTTSGGLRRLPRALELHRPVAIIIELGGNDGLRGYPVSLLQKNLEEMINLAGELGARVLLFGMKIPPNYGATYSEAFADVFPSVARENDAAYLDIDFLMETVSLNPELMQADRIHPNAQAQPLILENVWAILEPEILDPMGPCQPDLRADTATDTE